MSKYNEIIELYEYCQKIGVEAKISPLFDGFCIRFKNGGDVVQHFGSYGKDCCVEFAIGSSVDYKATSLKNAKSLVRRHKEKLNGKPKGGEQNGAT